LFFDDKPKIIRHVPKDKQDRISNGHYKKGWSYKKFPGWSYDSLDEQEKKLSKRRFRRIERDTLRILQLNPEDMKLLPEKHGAVAWCLGVKNKYRGYLCDKNAKDPTKEIYKRK